MWIFSGIISNNTFQSEKYLPGYARKKLKEQYGNLAKQVSKQGNDKRGNLRARKTFCLERNGKAR